MDYQAIGAAIITGILGIGAVGVFLGKILPKITKYIHIAKDALDLAEAAIKALEDKSLTAEEISVIKAKYDELTVALKA